MTSEDDVRRIALALPDTGERLSYGTPAWFVGKKLFVRICQGGELMARTADLTEKELLVNDVSGHFFTTPHYDGFAAILVRLPGLDADELQEIITDAWRARAGKRMLAAFDTQVGGERDG